MVAPAYASDTSGLDFQQFVEEFAGKKDFFVELASATLSVAGTAVAVAQLDQAKRSADEAKRSADEAKRSADEAFKASPEGNIQQALAKAMEPFEPSRPQDEVIQRPVMETLRQRIASWQQHATITGGRYQSGKSVATEEALRGARGVVRCTIESSDCKRMMFEELKVEDGALFKEVMRRAREKLKGFPDNLTKFPILLLEVNHRRTGWTKYVFQLSIDAVAHFALVFLFPFRLPRHQLNLLYCEGCGDGQNRKCHSCPPASMQNSNVANGNHVEGVVSMSDYPLSKVIVSASSAAVALAFDAGGTERQEDIWVGDLTEEEAKEFLALHGHENKWEDFVDACVSAQFHNMLVDQGVFAAFKLRSCFFGGTLTEFISGGFRIGDLAKACENLKRLALA